MQIEGCELIVVLDFAGKDIRPLTQFTTITQTLITYRSSLKLNLDILQSLYRVGVQVFTSLRAGTQRIFFQNSHLRSESLSQTSRRISRGSFFQVLSLYFIEQPLTSFTRDYPLAAPFLLRVLPINVNI